MTRPPGSRPQVVAHRGAASRAAEHTLAAYQKAIEMGAQALECDVRLTSDGHLVCVHDARIDRTSDGSGKVSTKTLAQLEGHDFSTWWAREHEDPERQARAGAIPDYDEERGGVLTLDRLLQLLVDAPGRLEIAVETKHPLRYGSYLEQSVVQALGRFGLLGRDGARPRARVMSFSSVAAWRMRELAPDIPVVYLVDKLTRSLRHGRLPTGANVVGPGVDLVREHPETVRLWKSRGHGLHIWVVDTVEDLGAVLPFSPDAVITNRPDDMVGWLDEAFGA